MTAVLTVFAYALQFGALLLLPTLLFFCLKLRTGKQTAALASLLLSVLLIMGAAWLAFHPIRTCPEELRPYMTESRWQDILSVTPPVYDGRLPVIPVQITVEWADDTDLRWRTRWFPAGTTRTGLSPDGYYTVHGLQ
ncbi:MAG: hypothetical protein IKU58_02940 [Clostridia bacterium]|nr:hypothetical protein [Clostridia bacterium]